VWPLVRRLQLQIGVTTDAIAFPSNRSSQAHGGPDGVHKAFWLAAIIVVFNLIDGVLTLAVVTAGVASEANPLMDAGLSWGGVPFILIKTALVSLGVSLLYLRRERRLAHVALIALTMVYAGIVAYHANSLHALVSLAA
jgi:hypothetical protein